MTGGLTEALTSTLCRLSGVLRYYEQDTEAGGREALRVLHTAGLAWCDLLGQPSDKQCEYLLQVAAYGYRVTSQRECAGLVMLHLARATPFELARAAFLANLRAPTQHQVDALASLAQKLVETSLEPTPTDERGGYFGAGSLH